MENALLVSVSRQMALRRELDIIANNVANITTNGFKARSARARETFMPQASADAFQRPDRKVSFVIDAGSPLDLTGGPIERTGNPLNAAIKGEGFFVVQTAAGERYTRDGAFEINAGGQVVTPEGQPVLGDGGPIVLAPGERGLQIAADGTISTDQGQRGRLRVVRFANPQTLQNEGQNLFSSPVAPQPANDTARIEGGAVERSNVKAVVEMARLVEVNRAYSSVSSLVGRIDELRRTAISRLADMPA